MIHERSFFLSREEIDQARIDLLNIRYGDLLEMLPGTTLIRLTVFESVRDPDIDNKTGKEICTLADIADYKAGVPK